MENIYLQKQGQKTLKDIIKEGKMEKILFSGESLYFQTLKLPNP